MTPCFTWNCVNHDSSISGCRLYTLHTTDLCKGYTASQEGDVEGTATITECIPDEEYTGMVQECMDNATFFTDAINRIRDLETALTWCAGAKCFKNDPENEFNNTVGPLLKCMWF